MSDDKNNEPMELISSAVPVSVKSAIKGTAKREARTVSYVTARILEAWATGRPLPYRKRKAA